MTDAAMSGVRAPAEHISDEVRARIGQWSARVAAPHPVEPSEVRRFAQALMDDAPRYVGTATPGGRDYGGAVAPPAFAAHAFRRPPGAADPLDRLVDDPDFDGLNRQLRPGLAPLPIALPRLLNGGYEYEFFRYFANGQTIYVRSRYKDVYQKEGRGGAMVFMVIEDEYSDDAGALYLRSINTLILR